MHVQDVVNKLVHKMTRNNSAIKITTAGITLQRLLGLTLPGGHLESAGLLRFPQKGKVT